MINGNIVGGARAEVDGLIDKAFVSTSDFQALINTRDFNFVVGRRGTGKTALFIKVGDYINKNKIGFAFRIVPEEHEQLELQSQIKRICSDYRTVRSITRVAWKASLLIEIFKQLSDHYKFKKSEKFKIIADYCKEYLSLLRYPLTSRSTQIIKSCSNKCDSPEEIAGCIASEFSINGLEVAINDSLLSVNKPVYFLLDGLDEGWYPNEFGTAILGGLALCAADFLDKRREIVAMLFIRDNIFRSLNYFDKDFTRHIEGNTIRLTWDEESLLHLIANRLRITLDIDTVENNVKVWNSISAGDLKNKNGFRSCLNYTLFRPRDIIVLINSAFNHISRSGRRNLIKDDLEYASRQISETRLNDLYKEYDVVFPGLNLLIKSFTNKSAFQNYSQVVEQLEEAITNNDYSSTESSDFAVLGSGKEAFFALFSVGFIGLAVGTLQDVKFCHDGSPAQLDASDENQMCCVHPCYWKALNLQSEILEEKILVRIQDEEKTSDVGDIIDYRTKRIGQIISELPKLEEGKKDAGKFEDWVFQGTQILFSGQLSNFELHPNKNSTQRRDVVATNIAEKGFWRRVREDYNCRQVVFEIKNFSNLKPDNFRQALSYSGGLYGKLVVIVYRSNNEGIPETDRGWIQEMWHQHNMLVFLIPVSFLSRCISKLRTSQRFNYTEKQLQKRLDTFERNYLSIRPHKKK